MLVKDIQALIERAGFEAHIVGGAVRDQLLGLAPADYDLATNMPLAQLKVFCDALHLSFAMALDLIDTKVAIIEGIEVAQFRKDVYEAGKFKGTELGTIEEDAARRDFTINALYLRNGEILDFVGGLSDLKRKVIRTCGNPLHRLTEDPSRILRAAYLAAKLGFTLDPRLVASIKDNKALIQLIHPNLVGKIVKKAVKAACFHDFLEQLEALDIVFTVFPQWQQQHGAAQNSTYHHLDVWAHTKGVVKSAEMRRSDELSYVLGAFCHDMAKALPHVRETRNGRPSDVNHEVIGAPLAKQFILSIGLGKDIAREVSFYTKYHGKSPALTQKSVRKCLREIAPNHRDKFTLRYYVDRLLNLMEDDAANFTTDFCVKKQAFLRLFRPLVHDVMEQNHFYTSDLPIDGSFVMAHSTLRGAAIGEFLDLMVQENVHDVDTILTRLERFDEKKNAGTVNKNASGMDHEPQNEGPAK